VGYMEEQQKRAPGSDVESQLRNVPLPCAYIQLSASFDGLMIFGWLGARFRVVVFILHALDWGVLGVTLRYVNNSTRWFYSKRNSSEAFFVTL
jgi:hypothetical protein